MFRALHRPLLAKVPYASLFAYNRVLQSVFEAPADKVAVVTELPASGPAPRNFTYGQLQRDVVAAADVLVRRREALCKARGEPSLSWVQPSKPEHVRSIYTQGERTPSCDCMQDTGFYNTSLMCGPGYTYVVSLLACWATNMLATPMSVSQRYDDELMYVLEHSGSHMLLGETALLKDKFPSNYEELYIRTLKDIDKIVPQRPTNTYKVETVVDFEILLGEVAAAPSTDSVPLQFDTDNIDKLNVLFRRRYESPESMPKLHDDCLMIYTSGTTARPKGVVHTHASVGNMVKVLQDAWEWRSDDSILHVLPVHHVHGLVNVLLCSLASGARCVMTKFDNPARIAHRLEQGDITLFMAVPTIYTKLIATINRNFSDSEKVHFKSVCEKAVRLMVCGSAALPVPTLNQFREISGHTLLERYGMTEIGMALSQPLRPLSGRHPGTVGSPLPTVTAFVYHPKGAEEESTERAVKEAQYDDVGALAIASESLFDRYWNNPTATKKELRTNDAGVRLFDTGDTVGVKLPKEAGKPAVFTILGRSSIDIIKSRGYKLSALEIEAALLSRKDLFYEIAVVGTKDDVRGEAVVAIVALQPVAAEARKISFSDQKHVESPEVTAELKAVALKLLAPYQCPERYIFLPEIPRNATGKVNKKDLKKLLNL